MEYSVHDLIRILIKKWYIILAVMVLIGGISMFTAQKSYQNALAQYEAYTTEIPPQQESVSVEVGQLVANYQYGFKLTDISRYTMVDETKAAFLEMYADALDHEIFSKEDKISAYSAAETALSRVSSDFSKLLTDSLVIQKTQDAIKDYGYTEPGSNDPLNVAGHYAAERLDNGLLRVTITGLEQETAAQIQSAYMESLLEVGAETYDIQITATEKSSDFFPDKAVTYTPSESVQFSQTVMQKPEKMAPMVKTVGTAVIYAFVLACFGVLLVTFAKEGKARGKSRS